MVAKIATLILAAALTAAALLVVRQQRLQAVHEMADAAERAQESDRKLWRLRADIARLTTPASVEKLAGAVGPLEPIPVYWCPPVDLRQLRAAPIKLELHPTDPDLIRDLARRDRERARSRARAERNAR